MKSSDNFRVVNLPNSLTINQLAMFKKYLFPTLLLFLFGKGLAAQEILATVKFVTPQLQNTDRKVFDQLEGAVRSFINTRKWTNDEFEQNERIKMNFIVTVSEELGNNTFKAELSVQATRPVFGSTYESPLLTHLDKDFVFTWDIGQPLDFNYDLIQDNLTAVLAFYAYLAIGLDYDSFSPNGGEQYLNILNQIVTNIPPQISQNSPGWKASDSNKSRNRYFITESILAPRLKPLRQAMYTYHRKGLDEMSNDVEKGKIFVAQALEDVEKASTAGFNSMIVQMFANAKRDELIEMFKTAARPQKERVYQIMSKVDPANSQKYQELRI